MDVEESLCKTSASFSFTQSPPSSLRRVFTPSYLQLVRAGNHSWSQFVILLYMLPPLFVCVDGEKKSVTTIPDIHMDRQRNRKQKDVPR